MNLDAAVVAVAVVVVAAAAAAAVVAVGVDLNLASEASVVADIAIVLMEPTVDCPALATVATEVSEDATWAAVAETE